MDVIVIYEGSLVIIKWMIIVILTVKTAPFVQISPGTLGSVITLFVSGSTS